jgi:hypothetical protein
MAKHECGKQCEHGIMNFAMLSPRANKNVSTVKNGGVLPREDKWAGPMPKGWTDSSRSSFYDSMSQAENSEGPTTNCMNKIAGHVDDPGAFCAALRDRVTGTTKWRHGGGNKK